MPKKTFAWIVFFGALLLLVFSASSYVQGPLTLFSGQFALGFLLVSPFSSLGTGGGTTTMGDRQILRIIFSLPRFAGSTVM